MRRQQGVCGGWLAFAVAAAVAACAGPKAAPAAKQAHATKMQATDAGGDGTSLGAASGSGGQAAARADAGQDRSVSPRDAAVSDAANHDAAKQSAPAFPPDEDADGDGLTNATELAVGTDPRYIDTDMDGVRDDEEVGADLKAPLDTDHDDVIDALEKHAFDNDRDGTPDDVDMADRWQVVYGRFVPAVLANDGSDPTRFEVKLAKDETVTAVEIGMSSMFHRAEWAPDELEVDGAALGNGRIQLFDDGTHGDVIAGDHVYSRGGIATHMALRSDRSITNGKRCRVLLNELSVTSAAGTTNLLLGKTDGTTPSLMSDFGFWLPIVGADLLETPQLLNGVGQQTSHVLNIVDAQLQLLLEQEILAGLTKDEQRLQQLRASAASIAARALAPFDADFDFVYVFTSEPVYSSLAGFELSVANDVRGIGANLLPLNPASGSAGRLRAVLHFPMATEYPLTHETLHSYGVYLQPTLGTADNHWGTAGTNGVLGGFDPTTLVDHGDGTFTLGHFSEMGNDWRTTLYSPIELYLLGLVPASSVSPIPVLENVSVISNDTNAVTVSAQKRMVTIDDIISAQGARIPASVDARKTFDALFVLLSDRLLKPAEIGLTHVIAVNLEHSTASDFISFEQATGGRATLSTTLPAVTHR